MSDERRPLRAGDGVAWNHRSMRCLLDENNGFVLLAPAEVAIAVPVSTVMLVVPGTDSDRLEQLRESLMLGPQIAKRARALLGKAVNDGVTLIAEERRRQVEREGWSASHDASHERGVLAKAAACYAVHDTGAVVVDSKTGHDAWPWSDEWDKRDKHDELRRLVIAGALIAAEIDRMVGGVEQGGVEQPLETASEPRTVADVVRNPPDGWSMTMHDTYLTQMQHTTHASVSLHGPMDRISGIQTYVPQEYNLEARVQGHLAVAELLQALKPVYGKRPG